MASPNRGVGKAQRLQVNLVLVVGVVQHHVAMDVVDLGHRANIARNAGGDFGMFFAVELEQVADLERFAAVADEELAVLGDRALVDAENAELADEGVDQYLEDMGHDVLLRDRGWRGVPPTDSPSPLRSGSGLPSVGLGSSRVNVSSRFLQAGAGAGRNEADRNQMAFAQRLLEGFVQLFRL
jgi:hypothetical protein